MHLLVWGCAALTGAIILLTVAQTREAYPSLPPRVPIQLGIDGRVNSYGPRPAIWMLPALQGFCTIIFFLCGYAIVMRLPGTHGSLAGLTLTAPIVIALLWRAQKMLLDVARSAERRQPLGSVWLFFGAGIAAILTIATVIG